MTQFLIVDDDTLFTRALEQELVGLRPEALIHRAVRVESATRLLQINRYDVIFLDLRLPDAQGIGVVTTTARLANGSKIVVVSAYDDPRLMRAAFEEGAIGFLPKALDLPATQAALHQVLDRGFFFPPEALSESG